MYEYTAYKMQYYSLIFKLFNFSSGYYLYTTSNKEVTFWFQFRLNLVENILGEYLMIFFIKTLKQKLCVKLEKSMSRWTIPQLY